MDIEITAVSIPAQYEMACFSHWRTCDSPKVIRDTPIFGLWADRDDISDGVSYVNALRNNRLGQVD